MSLPKALQAQIDEAARIERELSGEPPVNAQPDGNQQPVSSQEPVATAPVVPSVDVPVVSEATWEHRFKTFEGQHRAELSKAAKQNNEFVQLQNMVQNLTTELANVKSKAHKEAVQQTAPQVTDADRETYGPDIINLIERIAASKQAVLEDENLQLKAQLNKIEQNIGNVQQAVTVSDEEKLLSKLEQKVPTYREVNVDPKFIEWLAVPDPIYGEPKQAALNRAYLARDAERVATIFKAYIGDKVAKPVTQSMSPELNNQIAPSRNRTQAPKLNADEKTIWTEEQIKQFYLAKRRGELTDEEAARIEQDLNAAVQEGRVRT